MSADEIHDLEEEIPTSRIVTLEKDDNNTNDNSYAESNNFIEFLIDEDLDDGDIEYIEYSDMEDHISHINENKGEYLIKEEPKDEQEDSVEEILPDIEVKKENLKDELYHCSSCNINFSSVMDHIKTFHKNQSVIIDGSFEENKDNTNEEQNDEIKKEKHEEEFYSLSNFTNSDDVEEEFSYIDENSSLSINNMHIQTINEEKIDDAEVEKLDDNQCAICQTTFGSLEELSQHNCEGQLPHSKVVSDPKPRFACTLCSSVYQNQRSLASHMRVHKNPKKEKYEKTLPSEETNTRCEICNTTFPTMKSLKLHRRMHGPIKTKPFEDTIGYDLKAISKDRASGETFFCELCNKSYDVMFQDIHKKSHKAGQKFICHGCNKKFSNKISLTMHMKVHQEYGTTKKQVKVKDGVALPYECGFCGKQFTRPHEKVKHERIHTGEKPFKCEICGKCFRVSYCLTLHLRTHTGARPYVCAHCNKRFKSYSVYNHHLMTHSDERPYKCPFCPKTFKTSVQLGGHKNSHTKPFSCPECNRPFASLYSVKAHMETHVKGSRNLKHRCIVCGAIYARIFALRDHMKEQHQSVLNEEGEVSVNDIVIENEDIISAQSIMTDNEEEITVGEIEQFQTEEVVTDWLK